MKVKIWNDNTYPYTEEFKGDKIHIEANKYVEMEREEAVLFMGQFNSIVRDVDGNPHPKSFKKLRMDTSVQEKAVEKGR